MKKTTIALTTLLVGTMSIGGAAFAHGNKGDRGDRGARIEQMFETMDANKDGKITAEEITAASQARFTEADTDGDGFLSAEELEAQGEKRRGNRAERALQRLDANEDGKLSFEEVSARDRGGRMLERLDADGDGALTKAELEEAGKKRKGRGGKSDRSDN